MLCFFTSTLLHVLSQAWHWHAGVVRHALHITAHNVQGMVKCPAVSACHPAVQTLACNCRWQTSSQDPPRTQRAWLILANGCLLQTLSTSSTELSDARRQFQAQMQLQGVAVKTSRDIDDAVLAAMIFSQLPIVRLSCIRSLVVPTYAGHCILATS